MASITIPQRDLRRLPRVCVNCGRPATGERVEMVAYTPEWARLGVFVLGLVPFLLLVLMTRREVTVSFPVCDRHERLRRSATTAVWLGVGLAGLAGLTGGVMMSNGAADTGETLLMAAVGILVVVGLATLFVKDDSISAKSITDTSVTLDGVCDEFVDAVEGDEVPLVLAARNPMALESAKYLKR